MGHLAFELEAAIPIAIGWISGDDIHEESLRQALLQRLGQDLSIVGIARGHVRERMARSLP